MSLRALLFVVGTLLMVLFTLLNWPEISRPAPLNLGWTTVTAAPGLVLLAVLAVVTLGALASGAATRSRHLRREREQERALQTQRELADRAEASRFIDLRQMLEAHLRESREHDAKAAAGLDQSLARQQREWRTQMEALHRALVTRMGEMEARLEARLVRAEPAPQRLVEPARDPQREPVPPR